MAELQDYHKDKIMEIISELSNVPVEKITEETRLSDGLGLDSLDVVEMVMELEEAFDCNIPDEDYSDVKTVEDIFKVVENRI